MIAAVLSIGTELTRGELVNTNARWIAEELTTLGFDVVEHETVDDDRARIVSIVRRLSESARVVVATGGLGPTTDDLTTAAVADAAGVDLFRDPASLEAIRRRFAAFNREMTPSNEKQADFPRGAHVLPNPVGTAPGFAIEIGTARFFFMPGVPVEMRRMFEDRVVPQIAPLVERTMHQVHLRTFGLTESRVGELLAGLERDEPRVTIGYRAHFPEIEVKVLARAESEQEAEAIAKRVAEIVRERLGDAVYGERDDTFPAYVGNVLRERGWTLSVAESCTGGLVGQLVTSVAGSSDYLLLDAVTYSNAAKTSVLGVSGELLRAHGAVSSECAAAMAEGVRRICDSDVAVSITGIAGPGGGTDDKPVGTVWLGLARRGQETRTQAVKLPGDRERIRTLAAYLALRWVARAAAGAGEP